MKKLFTLLLLTLLFFQNTQVLYMDTWEEEITASFTDTEHADDVKQKEKKQLKEYCTAIPFSFDAATRSHLGALDHTFFIPFPVLEGPERPPNPAC